jgi:hypothetical protein
MIPKHFHGFDKLEQTGAGPVKVLLVSLNRLTAPYPVYPLGLDYVAGAIRDRHPVRIVDLAVPGSLERLAAEIRSAAPDLVGLSIRNIDNTDASNPRILSRSTGRLSRNPLRFPRSLVLGEAASRFSRKR